jgi:hypothetical protein
MNPIQFCDEVALSRSHADLVACATKRPRNTAGSVTNPDRGIINGNIPLSNLRWESKKRRSLGLTLPLFVALSSPRETALLNETHVLREQIHAEDSKYKKAMKTLK